MSTLATASLLHTPHLHCADSCAFVYSRTRASSSKPLVAQPHSSSRVSSRQAISQAAVFSPSSKLRLWHGVRRKGVVRCKASVNDGGELPPSSREEAIEQAATSVSSLLEKALKRQGPSTVKQRRETKQIKLRVEIPVLDDSSSSNVSLTFDFLSALFRGKKKGDAPNIAVLFADDESSVNLARKQCEERGLSSWSFFNLQSEVGLAGDDAAVVVLVGAKFEDNVRTEDLLKKVYPRPVVVVNPEWSAEEEKDTKWGALLSGFEVAYSFIPLSIQGFLSKTEGAVLKHVKSGAPGGRPWLIFVKEGDQYKRMSSLQRRPEPSDLENALYNAMAANSPVTKSIQFLRGLVSKE